MASIASVFDAVSARVEVAASSKREAVAALVELLGSAGAAPDPASLVAAVMEREALAPTGLCDDCAIPHAQTEAAPRTALAVIRLARPVDFGAPDGTPARLVFLIVGPKDSAAAHLKLLSKLARVLSDPDFRAAALSAADDAALASVVLSIDPPALDMSLSFKV